VWLSEDEKSLWLFSPVLFVFRRGIGFLIRRMDEGKVTGKLPLKVPIIERALWSITNSTKTSLLYFLCTLQLSGGGQGRSWGLEYPLELDSWFNSGVNFAG
jgi:hypothetical protein